MGCSTSHSKKEDNGENIQRLSANQMNFMTSSLRKLLKSKNPQNLLMAFVKLDNIIQEEENKSPSSVFGQAMSRQHQIKSHLESALEIKSQNEILSEESSIEDIFTDLGLIKNPEAAPEHEEFIASINRRALNQFTIDFLEKNLGIVEEEIKMSSKRISQLQGAYQQQDELLSQIFGESYGSETEKRLEKELDTMRYYKDILSIGVFQWEVCERNVQKAVHILQKGITLWRSLENEPLEKKISLATEARNCLQEAVLLVRISEELLQDVQFPFCTTRELRSVTQVTDYVFSDISIKEKYLNVAEVYKNFLGKANSLQVWIQEVLNSRLKEDLFEIENKVSKKAKQLKHERLYLICKKLKIEDTSGLSDEGIFDDLPIPNKANSNDTKLEIFDFDKFPINLQSKLGIRQNHELEDFNVKNYFQKIVENRKSTMWPSRRIDELQSMRVQQ